MAKENRQFDIVVFGASGYTGCYVVQKLAKCEKDIKWCVAGRNKEKLKSALTKVGKTIDMNLDDVAVLEANVDDKESLLSMCSQAKLVINCVGPYRFFGEQMVQACVECGTDHLDVSGEPQFLESMQLKYFKEAQEKGIYIVGACGFDSIPCDLGVEVFKNSFDGDINAIESFMKLKSKTQGGGSGNFATWQSAIYGLAHAAELKSLRKELKAKVFPKSMPRSNYPIPKRPLLFKDKETKSWNIPFIGSDKSIVQRTQMYNFQYENQRPVQMQAYLHVESLLRAVVILFMGAIFTVLVKFRAGQNLLEKYPEFFSFGTFTKTEPPMRSASDGLFNITLRADGWSEKLAEPSDQHTDKPNKTASFTVKGPEPYVATAICVINAALVVLTEREKLPGKGGVLTPGAAFRCTSLHEMLEKDGITFGK